MSDFSRDLAVKAGKAHPMDFENNEKTIDDLMQRIYSTLNILESVQEHYFMKEEERIEIPPIGGRPMHLTAKDYTLKFTMPKVYFHIIMACALLRKEGIEVENKDHFDNDWIAYSVFNK
ncbi:hypothetical protein Golomagni_07235 [Golovinomyces magnicellulatus]|nr:hypothetical protein Golomagni_07235 [Golovinomyces magnicellulatus]